MDDRDDPLALANQLCFALYSASHAFTRTYRRFLDPLGLTYPQYLVMLALWERDDEPVKAIGDRVRLDSGTLTPLLKRMEASGFLQRRRDPADERSVRIRLTPAGAALRAEGLKVRQKIGAAIADAVPDLAGLRDAVARLRDVLED